MSDFQLFISDQLAELGDLLRFKRMFGGWGLYYGSVFFGLIADGRLYFKTDEHSRQTYIQAKMQPFTFQKAHQKKESVMKNYYEVPVHIVENNALLCEWAEEAISRSEKTK